MNFLNKPKLSSDFSNDVLWMFFFFNYQFFESLSKNLREFSNNNVDYFFWSRNFIKFFVLLCAQSIYYFFVYDDFWPDEAIFKVSNNSNHSPYPNFHWIILPWLLLCIKCYLAYMTDGFIWINAYFIFIFVAFCICVIITGYYRIINKDSISIFKYPLHTNIASSVIPYSFLWKYPYGCFLPILEMSESLSFCQFCWNFWLFKFHCSALCNSPSPLSQHCSPRHYFLFTQILFMSCLKYNLLYIAFNFLILWSKFLRFSHPVLDKLPISPNQILPIHLFLWSCFTWDLFTMLSSGSFSITNAANFYSLSETLG